MKQTKLGKLRTVVLALLALCMVFALTACRTDDNGSLKITAQIKTVDVGKSITIFVSGNGGEAVSWSSSNDAVATVESLVASAARVNGVSVGTATITATAGGNTATVQIAVTAPEVITITNNGAAVTAPIQLSKNGTVQLAATSTKGHDINWLSGSELIATVSESGLVTAVASSGTATITAECGGSDNGNKAIKAEVTITIGSGVNSSYEIKKKESDNDIAAGKWIQWSEFGNVNEATYNDGVVTIDFSNDYGRWVNVQLTYYPTSEENIVQGKLYKLEFDLDLEFHDGFEKAGGKVTVNNNVVDLTAGKGHYTVYYVQDEASFAMLMGYDDGTELGKCELIDARVTISNIKWTQISALALVAPTFSIGEDGKITITDTNPTGSVGNYVLTLYNDNNKIVGQTLVENGKTVNVSRIMTNGTFTAKIKALAASALYINSPEGAGATGADTVTVDNAATISYDLGFKPGVMLAGQWYYWSESWVGWAAKHYDGETDKVTATFSNNQGNFYDTQIFYKSCHAVGETYTVKLHINVTASNIGEGKVTINGKVYNLVEGDNVITLNITETDDASVIIMFGVSGQSTMQDIKSGTVVISVEEA